MSFTLSPELWTDALARMNGDSSAITIGSYDTASGTWTALPTTVDPVTHSVSARITHFSTYGLIFKPVKETPTTIPETTVSIVSPTPVMSQQAPPETTKSPGISGVAVIGVVLIVGYFVRREKQ